ncbi:hypothetical protein AAMO2058_000822100 [Amorphochlora amoebiformis]|mmetsp:Transcript_18519/g.29529  ORF Transcript_18519/g.29529 Transcript_18519/m.29529 type:complete len:175 (-) Transcript_18519:198-722(-)
MDWKSVYDEKCKELEGLKKEHDEFQKTTEMLDRQLEAQLDAAMRKSDRLQGRLKDLNQRVSAEKVKVKVETDGEAKLLVVIEELENECRSLRTRRDNLNEAKAELDMAHARVSKENSQLMEQLDDVEEENVLLEQDLQAMQQTKSETIQRVKDELRDVQHELSAMLLDKRNSED